MGLKFNPLYIRLIAGLGNPGEQYGKTYHNAGALFADFLTDARIKPQYEKISSKRFIACRKENAVIIKPTLSMNESGGAVREALSFYKGEPQNLLVLHDDSDLALGSFKLHFGRGSAGHKGVASIIKILKTPAFWRLRIGIRVPEHDRDRRREAGEFVLRTIRESDLKVLFKTFRAARAVLFPTPRTPLRRVRATSLRDV